MGIKKHRRPWSVAAWRQGLGAGLIGFCAMGLAGPAAALDVPLVAASRSADGVSLRIEGHLEAQRQATMAAQLAGTVLALHVQAGDRVRAGQVLARIDERDALAGLQRSQAGLLQAEAELHKASTAAERTRVLRGQGFVSQAALDGADTQLRAAEAGLQQARAARSQAALARGFAAVVAPFDGVVAATHLEAGDLASPGRPVATLYAPGALRAVAQVPLSQAAAARSATARVVELADGRRVQPARHSELASADAVSQTVAWRLDVPSSASAGLLPGQVVRVHFVGAAGAHAAAGPRPLRLPAAAVLRRGELTAVYVARGAGFQLRAVRLGRAQGEGVEVLAGLKDGERVAADAVRAGLAGARPLW